MPTTSTGDPSRIASVNRLRTKVSSVRRVSTRHCVSPLAAGRRSRRRPASPASRRRARRSAVR